MLPLIRPDLAFDDVARDLRRILDSGLLTRGPTVEAFEQAIAGCLGMPFAVATSSATTALHLALVAAGVGAGDEVLVSDFTFPASGNAIVHCGAVPVPVDCRPGRFDLDLEDAAARVTPRTRALMPVHPFGQPADLEACRALADRHGLILVEDAACALGAGLPGLACGTVGNAGCFSFHPRKLPTTGEGGMVVTADPELAARCASLRNQGAEPGPEGPIFTANGFNYRLSEIPAALGLVQLGRFEALLADRRVTAGRYLEGLAGLDEVTVPLSAPAEACTFQSMVVLLDDVIDRDAVIRFLRGREIESTIGTYALHAEPAFARFGCRPGCRPHAWRARRRALTLPLVPRMPPADVDRVVRTLAEALPRCRSTV